MINNLSLPRFVSQLCEGIAPRNAGRRKGGACAKIQKLYLTKNKKTNVDVAANTNLHQQLKENTEDTLRRIGLYMRIMLYWWIVKNRRILWKGDDGKSGFSYD